MESAVRRAASLSLCPDLWERDAFRRSTCPPTLLPQPITGQDTHTHARAHTVAMVTASPLSVLESKTANTARLFRN